MPEGLINAMLSEQENYLTIFTNLLIEEEKKQQAEGTPNVINDSTCK